MSQLRIRYANQLAVSEFDLEDQVNLMKGEAAILKGILGPTTQLDGFACTPNSPADLSVIVGEGTIFILKDVLDTALGELPTQIPADTTHEIVKYAYKLDPTSFSITPPATSGNSRNDLIQINFAEADGNPKSIPFYNGFNGQILNPPSFATKNTQRIDSVVISIKQGTQATTGTQTTPSPDAGYVGAWVVTTTNGQTTITSGNITAYPNAPFITEKLKDKISQATADERYIKKPALQVAHYYFRATVTTTQNLALNTIEVVDYNFETFDPAGWFNPVTGKLQPTIPCVMQLRASLGITTASAGVITFTIGKNDVSNADNVGSEVEFPGTAPTTETGGVFIFNGTTDFVQVFARVTVNAVTRADFRSVFDGFVIAN